jgi:hypothetical protein
LAGKSREGGAFYKKEGKSMMIIFAGIDKLGGCECSLRDAYNLLLLPPPFTRSGHPKTIIASAFLLPICAENVKHWFFGNIFV